ncbi:microfibrillar-associated protein 1-like [Tropilaelaps mercedesae]|uniref:Microfibrillar-associated protein 1-like n=1 Tax=Tropilaelaps mercedesae TaxID=418985 RepID=A0A1V9XBT6_9ACAR|nr:microfibrillar-associated protein 1-like [Tropilaelaps mercedesae]
MEDIVHQNSLIQSTAGAVPVVNDKGEVYMKKVKVQRYVSGRRPRYAPDGSEESQSSDDDFIVERQKPSHRSGEASRARTHRGAGSDDSSSDDNNDRKKDGDGGNEKDVKYSGDESGDGYAKGRGDRSDDEDEEMDSRRSVSDDHADGHERQKADDSEDMDDPRLRRLQRRKVREPRVLDDNDAADSDDNDDGMRRRRHRSSSSSSSSSSNGDDLDEEERERKRLQMKQRALQRVRQEELEEAARQEERRLAEGDDDQAAEEDESDDYEEYTDTEEEEDLQGPPRLKPVFVRKKDRVTIHEREQQEQRRYEAELEGKRAAEERRRQTLKIVEAEVKREVEESKEESKTGACVGNIDDVCTDDDNDEAAYEAWKLRELKRLKRDRELREALEKEKLEIERLRSLTEEERLREAKSNPAKVTNRSSKGKYKFLQKYYHRGAFFVQEKEEDVYKRDFSAPTLEDHFDKSVLPKVMQVKNFGRSGRTKYTHLLDQDTTKIDSPWSAETPQNLKWYIEKAGGTKPIFERPSLRKKAT